MVGEKHAPETVRREGKEGIEMAKSLKDNLPDNVSKEDKKFVEKYGDMLSSSTQYAQWVSTPDEREEHPGKSLVTRSHDVIRQWAEERGAKPATIEGTEHDGHLGVLRFDFPGGDELPEVSWEDWFQAFDERHLVFVYQQHMKNGDQSN